MWYIYIYILYILYIIYIIYYIYIILYIYFILRYFIYIYVLNIYIYIIYILLYIYILPPHHQGCRHTTRQSLTQRSRIHASMSRASSSQDSSDVAFTDGKRREMKKSGRYFANLLPRLQNHAKSFQAFFVQPWANVPRSPNERPRASQLEIRPLCCLQSLSLQCLTLWLLGCIQTHTYIYIYIYEYIYTYVYINIYIYNIYIYICR